MSANDRQVGGDHYRGDGTKTVQHWDLMVLLNEGYFPAVITKYSERWDGKNGAQDVEKSLHYAEKWFESGQYELDWARRSCTGYAAGGVVQPPVPRVLDAPEVVIRGMVRQIVQTPEPPGEVIIRSQPQPRPSRLESILEYCRESKFDELQTRIFVGVLGRDRVSKKLILDVLGDLLERARLRSESGVLKREAVAERLVPRGVPERPFRPGTPEDGGHHAVADGMIDIPQYLHWMKMYRAAKERGEL